MNSRLADLKHLFIAFFKIGLFTIGGGYAMLPMLQREVVEHYRWATEEELMNYFAISQTTPGIIAINTATFIGFKRQGVLGGLIATLGMVFPSWIIIISIAAFFQHFSDNIMISKAFAGIRIVVIALIVNAVINMAKKSLKKWWSYALAILGFITVAILHLSPIIIIVVSGIIGIILYQMEAGDKKC